MLAQLVLFDGFAPTDVLAPFDVFAAAGMIAGGGLTAELVSAEGVREVPSGLPGVSLRASGRLDPDRADLVLVPGPAGRSEGDGDDTVMAILGRAAQSGLTPLLKDAYHRPGLIMTTVCGGTTLLSMAGLIGGRYATTHPLAMDLLAAAGTFAIDARVVDDGDLVTAGGVTSGLDLGLYLVERELGPRVALAVEKLFSFERRGTVWRNQGQAALAAL